MSIVERIKKECAIKNITITFLERENKLSIGAISKWNNSSPTAENLYKIAKYLNVSMEYLITGNEESTSFSTAEQEWITLYRELASRDSNLVKEGKNCIDGLLKVYQMGKENTKI